MLNRRTLLGAAGAGPMMWATAFPASAQAPRDVVVMGIAIDDIVSLDPQEMFEFSSQEIVSNTYDRLVLPNLKDPAEINGDLAESWSTSADGLTTTFRMAQGRLAGLGHRGSAACGSRRKRCAEAAARLRPCR